MFRSVLLAASLLTLTPSLVLADVARVIPAADAASCRLVAKQECKTTDNKGSEYCLQWHQQQARAEGADAVVVGAVDSFIRKRPSLNGVKTVTTTIVPATYYDCGFAPLSQPEGAAQKAIAPKPDDHSNIEQRLLTLQKLRDKDLISAEEYAQKRQQILDEL